MTFVLGALFGWAVVKVSDWARGRWGWGWMYVKAVEHGEQLAAARWRAEVIRIQGELIKVKEHIEVEARNASGRTLKPGELLAVVPAVGPS